MTDYQRRCEVSPRSVNATKLERSLANDVLAQLTLDGGWRDAVLRTLAQEGPQPVNLLELSRIETAIANLRKQHLWGAISDEDFQREFRQLERQRKVLTAQRQSAQTPNLDRAAELLSDLPALWLHTRRLRHRTTGTCLGGVRGNQAGGEAAGSGDAKAGVCPSVCLRRSDK